MIICKKELLLFNFPDESLKIATKPREGSEINNLKLNVMKITKKHIVVVKMLLKGESYDIISLRTGLSVATIRKYEKIWN